MRYEIDTPQDNERAIENISPIYDLYFDFIDM